MEGEGAKVLPLGALERVERKPAPRAEHPLGGEQQQGERNLFQGRDHLSKYLLSAGAIKRAPCGQKSERLTVAGGRGRESTRALLLDVARNVAVVDQSELPGHHRLSVAQRAAAPGGDAARGESGMAHRGVERSEGFQRRQLLSQRA